ncbi:MAG TPA: dehydrogenase [Porticoccaceae bacterium]|jgi:polyvinyl alcohol dehydrogenase (cytochrome)|nr:dehydrogenase [Porticoccaceae bacterium]
MHLYSSIRTLILIALSTSTMANNHQESIDYQIGQKRFDTHCAACHSDVTSEAPQMEALRLFAPEHIVTSLTSGIMSTAGLPLSEQEIRQVSYYLTGKSVDTTPTDLSNYFCTDTSISGLSSGLSKTGEWTNWGGTGNQRFQTDENILNPNNVKNLALKWAFAFPKATRIRSQPTVTAETTYIGSQDGTVFALSTQSGCIQWMFSADTEVRGALQYHEDAETGVESLLFGDLKANVYSINALSGALNWKVRVHDHPLALVTGSIVTDQQKVYVPVSSLEVVPAAQIAYPCCSFQGAMIALNIHNGTEIWKTYTTKKPIFRGKTTAGTDKFGPSGAPIWSSPTLDIKRNVIIATTGQNYSSPASNTSDAVIAMDTMTGEIKWVSQVTKDDAWNGACSRRTPNCPDEDGPDFDIGASAILITTNSQKDLLLIGQKSGLTYAMDPDKQGKIIWTRRVGSGGTMGGVHWGMSSDSNRLYVGVSDIKTNNPYAVGERHPGIHALNPETGEFIWRTPVLNICPPDSKFRCDPGISAAISSSPGLVFAGGMDGILRALDANSGDVLWRYDTRRSYQSINGIEGIGGSIEADGPVIANGELFITSGYDKWAEIPGNVLLVFALPNQSIQQKSK